MLSAILVIAVFLVDPIPQDPAYHSFADARSILWIPNFWNVVSNLPFLLVGGTGIYYTFSGNRTGTLPELRLAYLTFFAGIFLTGIGSAYYHLVPDNDSLMWDRLAMTIGFMALFAIFVGEHISVRIGNGILVPLLIIGLASVIYWGVTEARDAGDLRPYVVVQCLPMLLLPLILLMYPSVYDDLRLLWSVIVLYALSKMFEYFDFAVYGIGELISGHSLKHLFAALAPLVFLYAMDNRHTRDRRSR
jgi:hypothetical protein